MESIWSIKGTPSVREVLEFKYPFGEKAYTTVQTVMNNLETKGYLRKEKIGLVNFYKPIRKREQMVSREMLSVIKRMFSGSQLEMVSHLIKSESFRVEDLVAIRKLIDDAEQLKN